MTVFAVFEKAKFVPHLIPGEDVRNFVIISVILAAAGLSTSCGNISEREQVSEAEQMSESSPQTLVSPSVVYLGEDTSAVSVPPGPEPEEKDRNRPVQVSEPAAPAVDFDDIPEPDFSDWGGDLEDISPANRDEIAHSRLISSVTVPVISPDAGDDVDSLTVALEKRLSVRPDRFPSTVVLERWQSPVNYRGYKFNRRKLVLFGAAPHLPVRIYRLTDDYYFSVAETLYELGIRPEFSSFIAVRDTALSRYLLHFAD